MFTVEEEAAKRKAGSWAQQNIAPNTNKEVLSEINPLPNNNQKEDNNMARNNDNIEDISNNSIRLSKIVLNKKKLRANLKVGNMIDLQ